MDETEILQGVQKIVREALYKTQCNKAALARKLGMSNDALTGWQRGDVRRLDIINLVRLCQLAELSMDALFDLQGKGTALGSENIESWRERAERAEWMLDQIRDNSQATSQQTQTSASASIPSGDAVSGGVGMSQSDQVRLKLRQHLERTTIEALQDAQDEVDKHSVPKEKENQQPNDGIAKHG